MTERKHTPGRPFHEYIRDIIPQERRIAQPSEHDPKSVPIHWFSTGHGRADLPNFYAPYAMARRLCAENPGGVVAFLSESASGHAAVSLKVAKHVYEGSSIYDAFSKTYNDREIQEYGPSLKDPRVRQRNLRVLSKNLLYRLEESETASIVNRYPGQLLWIPEGMNYQDLYTIQGIESHTIFNGRSGATYEEFVADKIKEVEESRRKHGVRDDKTRKLITHLTKVPEIVGIVGWRGAAHRENVVNPLVAEGYSVHEYVATSVDFEVLNPEGYLFANAMRKEDLPITPQLIDLAIEGTVYVDTHEAGKTRKEVIELRRRVNRWTDTQIASDNPKVHIQDEDIYEFPELPTVQPELLEDGDLNELDAHVDWYDGSDHPDITPQKTL
jgi:hypothetical protein